MHFPSLRCKSLACPCVLKLSSVGTIRMSELLLLVLRLLQTEPLLIQQWSSEISSSSLCNRMHLMLSSILPLFTIYIFSDGKSGDYHCLRRDSDQRKWHISSSHGITTSLCGREILFPFEIIIVVYLRTFIIQVVSKIITFLQRGYRK